jgi:puromycin-sensitive aminopeptidase
MCAILLHQVLQSAEVTNVSEDEILIIRFDEVLPIGEGTLSIAFHGTLNDKMHGFYRRYNHFVLLIFIYK